MYYMLNLIYIISSFYKMLLFFIITTANFAICSVLIGSYEADSFVFSLFSPYINRKVVLLLFRLGIYAYTAAKYREN